MPRGAVLLAAALAGIGPAAAEDGCARHATAFPALIGGAEADVLAALRAMPGIRTIRTGAPDSPMTQDWRPDRATVIVAGGRVLRITCG